MIKIQYAHLSPFLFFSVLLQVFFVEVSLPPISAASSFLPFLAYVVHAPPTVKFESMSSNKTLGHKKIAKIVHLQVLIVIYFLPSDSIISRPDQSLCFSI